MNQPPPSALRGGCGRPASRALTLALAVAGTATLLTGAGACRDDVPPVEVVTIPVEFPPMPIPEANPLTAEGVAIGKALFYERRLSRTGELSCSTCHLQSSAFSDPRPVSVGVEGRTGLHNAQALVNVAWNDSFLWDGRAASLEEQVLIPLQDPLELDNTLGEVTTRLGADPVIARAFQRAYGEGPTEVTVSRALASFLRVLVSGNSRYDQYSRGQVALTGAELHGRDLFMGERAGCFHCHLGFNFTNNQFRNNGTAAFEDMGRASISLDTADVGKFKVPTLRNIDASAPYMHDGSLATLEEVIEHYNQGGRGHPNTDPAVHPLGLADDEKADLAAFLRTLTDRPFLTEHSTWQWP
jgi:cytochrome c peroxidase